MTAAEGQLPEPIDIVTLMLQPSRLLLDGDASGRLLVTSNEPGSPQLFELDHDGLRQITNFAEPVTGRYVPGARAAVVARDTGGNERYQLSLLQLDDGALEPLTDDPESVHELADVSSDGRLVAFLTNRRNHVDVDVVVRDLVTGHETAAYDAGGWCRTAKFSPDGRYLIVQRLGDQPMDTDLLLADWTNGTVECVTPHSEAAVFTDPSWLADSSAFYFSTNAGRETQAIARYDVEIGSWQYVLESEWDASAYLSSDASCLLVVENADGASRARLYAMPELTDPVLLPLPGTGVMTTTPPVLARDGSWVAFTWTSPRQLPDVWRWDRGAANAHRLAAVGQTVDPDRLCEPESHVLASFDGERIHTWLYRPVGAPGQQPPVALWIHGGPESQSCATFNPLVQALVMRGVAVLVPNVRGSTGYGRRFYSLDDTTKRLDAVEDLAALHRWLPTVGLDPTRAALMGGSYGGYMVLAGLSMQPDRWAAGVDLVGMSNLVSFLENTAEFRRRQREQEYGSLINDRAFLEQASPLTHVDSIRAPLLIIHGANDPRVPVGEAEQIAASLSARQVPCELVIYADEGHGVNKLHNRLDAFPRSVEFISTRLHAAAPAGGRSGL